MNAYTTETVTSLFITSTVAPDNIAPDLWEWAVALAGKAVVSTVLNTGIASIYIDQNAKEGAAYSRIHDSAEKCAVVDLASDAALHVLGIAEMNELEEPFLECNWKDAGWASEAVSEWEVWFEGDDDAGEDIACYENIYLVEACRLRALRILSRPGHREAVAALACAVLSPEGISGADAETLVRNVIERTTNVEDNTES